MNTGLDLALASIIGGVLLLLLVNMNSRVADETNRAYTEGMPVVVTRQIKMLLDYDLLKIGYGLIRPRMAITQADTNILAFNYKPTKAATGDSIRVQWQIMYPVVNKVTKLFPNGRSAKDSLPNINEGFVYRSVNGQSQLVSYGMTRFFFNYFDADGVQIGTPIDSTNRLRIKMIRVTYRIESRYRIPKPGERTTPAWTDTTAFPSINVQKMYRPRNLL